MTKVICRLNHFLYKEGNNLTVSVGTKLSLRVVFHHFMTNTVKYFINQVWQLKAD